MIFLLLVIRVIFLALLLLLRFLIPLRTLGDVVAYLLAFVACSLLVVTGGSFIIS